MKNGNLFIIELMYILNNTDYYMKALTSGGDERKVKFSETEYKRWLQNDSIIHCY